MYFKLSQLTKFFHSLFAESNLLKRSLQGIARLHILICTVSIEVKSERHKPTRATRESSTIMPAVKTDPLTTAGNEYYLPVLCTVTAGKRWHYFNRTSSCLPQSQ